MKIRPWEKTMQVIRKDDAGLGLKMKGKHQAPIWMVSSAEVRKVPKSNNWSLACLWAKSSSGSLSSAPHQTAKTLTIWPPTYLQVLWEKSQHINFSTSNSVTALLFLKHLKKKKICLVRYWLPVTPTKTCVPWINSEMNKNSIVRLQRRKRKVFPQPCMNTQHVCSLAHAELASVGVGSTGPFTGVSLFRASPDALLRGCFCWGKKINTGLSLQNAV